jgi:hypothetical protein
MDFEKSTTDWAASFKGAESKVPVMDLDRRVRLLEKMLPQFEQFIKYPALAEAYREYKVIETLVLGKDET